MFFRSKKYTCIDIGTYSIKIVQLKAAKHGVEIIDAGIQKLPRDTINDGIITDESLVSTELQNLINMMKVKPGYIVTTVPNNNLLIRNIEMPKLDQKDVKETLRWEADDQLPYPVENAALDYLLAGEDGETAKYLVAAVKNNVIDNYLAPYARLNLKPKVMNVQPMALLSLLDYQGELDGTIAIIDIGASSTQITVGNKKNIMLSRTIDTGGHSFTSSLMDVKSIEYAAAEEEKIEYGLGEADDEKEDFDKFMDSMQIGMEASDDDYRLNSLATTLSSEITRSFDFFTMKHREEEIKKVFITGGGARLKGLEKLISEEIGEELILIDPFKSTGYEFIGEPYCGDCSYEFSVAVGLGIAEVMADES